MQYTFARATHSAGRLSAARDDRVSYIQEMKMNCNNSYCEHCRSGIYAMPTNLVN